MWINKWFHPVGIVGNLENENCVKIWLLAEKKRVRMRSIIEEEQRVSLGNSLEEVGICFFFENVIIIYYILNRLFKFYGRL